MLIHCRILQFFSVVAILSILFTNAHVMSTSAQEGDGVERQYNAQTGKISFMGPESGSSVAAPRALGTSLRPQDPAMALAKRFGPEFGLKSPERDLVEMKTHQSEDGRLMVRYQQRYQGIPVMGGELNVNTNENGDLYSLNGEVASNLTLSTLPNVDPEQAVQTALEGAAEWYEKTPGEFAASTPELWIYNESLLRPSTRSAELVWRLEVTPRDSGMLMRELVLVNAQRGNISLHFNQVDTDWTFSGNTDIRQDPEPASPDPETSIFFNDSQKVRTYTAKHGISLPGVLLCDQSQPNCTNGKKPHADAAHTFAMGTYSLYQDKHNRNSIDNAGMAMVSTVHFASNYANAGWTGFQMIYGDAYGFALADDVVAHEFTHGVTQYESNLFYYYQSGAINESFSDLWGEYYDQVNGLGNDTPAVKWLMGEDISGMGTIRSMNNPPAYGDPDKMSSTYYFVGAWDNGGVHANSGVNNKAAYLMVEGGLFNSITVAGIGWDKTAAIYYEANTKLLSSGSDYSDLYYALQQACTNLIGQRGITSGDCASVKNAGDAVEMNGQPAPNFNTDAPICDAGISPTMIFSDDLESGRGNWTFSGGMYTRWQIDSYLGSNAHSGVHSLYADDFPPQAATASARLDPIVIPSRAYLRFAQAYDFQSPTYYYDGGVLEYSINGGKTWNDAGPLMDFNGYKGTIRTGTGNPLQGRSAFVGTSHGYISTRVNLASLAGKTVRFRWRMGLDGSGYAWGWWVDDVTIYRCLPPGVTTPIVSSVTRVDPNVTQAASVNFTVTFSEPVSGVDKKDFTLTTTGVTGPVITGVSGSGTTYTVSVKTGSKNGTIRLNVKDDDTIVNALNIPLGDDGKGNGDYRTGEVYSVVKSAPKPGVPGLAAPTKGRLVASLQPLLDWKQTSPVAHHYHVQVASNNTFKDLVVDDTNVSTSQFTLPFALTPGRQYYWRVRGLNIINGAGGWSAVRYFRTPLAQPVIISPAPNEALLTDRPAFNWDFVDGASQYTLQVSATSNFSRLLVHVTVDTAEYSMTKDLPQNKILYWRVRAKTPVVTSPWSTRWSFKTGNPPSVPVLVAPANNALVTDYTPLFNWNNSTVSAPKTFKHYEIEVDDNIDFSSPEITAAQTVSQFTPGSDLASNTKFYWRVRAVSTKDHVSGWSAVRSFSTILASPASLTVVPTDKPLLPNFDWDDAAGLGPISSYTIQISTSASFSTLLVNSTTSNSTYNLLKNLPSGRTIYWRVKVNGANGPSNWSTDHFLTP